jgi:hypothetical protein
MDLRKSYLMTKSNVVERTDEKQFYRLVNCPTTDDKLTDKEVYPEGLTTYTPTV